MEVYQIIFADHAILLARIALAVYKLNAFHALADISSTLAIALLYAQQDIIQILNLMNALSAMIFAINVLQELKMIVFLALLESFYTKVLA